MRRCGLLRFAHVVQTGCNGLAAGSRLKFLGAPDAFPPLNQALGPGYWLDFLTTT